MSATGTYSIFPAQLVGGSTLNLRQLHNVNLVGGVNKDIIIPGGALDPSAIPTVSTDCRVSFATFDLVSLLATVSASTGFAITGASKVQFQARTDGGAFEGSGAHINYSLTKGWAAIQSISASQGGGAEAMLALWPLFDGTNLPLVINTAQSLTSTPLFTSKFYHGPVYVNGVALSHVLSTSINFGIDYRTFTADGDVHARIGAIHARTPTFSITVANLGVGSTIGNLFNASLPGTIAAYFRKGDDGGDREADASTVHCKVSCASGVWNNDNVSVADNGNGTTTITAHCSATLSTSTAAAIGG